MSYGASETPAPGFNYREAKARAVATCPVCGRERCPVRADYRQATRTEPRQLLGYSGFCPDCEVSFKSRIAGVQIPGGRTQQTKKEVVMPSVEIRDREIHLPDHMTVGEPTWIPIQGKVIGFMDEWDDPDIKRDEHQDESMLVQDQNTGAIWCRWLGLDFVNLSHPDADWLDVGMVVMFHTYDGEPGTPRLTGLGAEAASSSSLVPSSGP